MKRFTCNAIGRADQRQWESVVFGYSVPHCYLSGSDAFTPATCSTSRPIYGFPLLTYFRIKPLDCLYIPFPPRVRSTLTIFTRFYFNLLDNLGIFYWKDRGEGSYFVSMTNRSIKATWKEENLVYNHKNMIPKTEPLSWH